MTLYKDEWLSHLKDSIPPEAKLNQTSLYTIALEGWRRGLSLSFYNHIEGEQRSIRYSLSNENKTHYFTGSSGDYNTKEAFDICDDKTETANYLSANNVPIPQGKTFKIRETSENEIVAYGNSIGYPLVVKPPDGSGGASVFANITSERALIDAVNYIKEKQQFTEVIVQQHVMGDEIRVYVLDGKVLAAANRLPANVLGDGKQTVAQLIREKNEVRKSVPHLHHRPIKMDLQVRRLIEQENYTLESVLPKGKRIYLRKTSNVSTGGDPIDVTNQLSKEQTEIAVNASKAIPGLVHSGVDIIINPVTNQTVVLEVNTRPGIGSHLFPIEGEAVDIPKALIDFYFPETKNQTTSLSGVYFDLQTPIDSLKSDILDEIVIVSPPKNVLTAKKYKINSPLNPKEFYDQIKKYVLTNDIQGFIKEDNRNLEIIVAHEKKEELNEFRSHLEKRKNLLRIKDIEENVYDKPIKMGFSVYDGLDSMSLFELETMYNQLNKSYKITEKEVARLKRRIDLMFKSVSWKITRPIRFITGRFNK